MIGFPTYRAFGESGILLEWPKKIDLQTHKIVMHYANYIRSKFGYDLHDVVPTYHSVALFLRPTVLKAEFVARLRNELAFISEEKKTIRYRISLPVCYDEEFGWDLREMADTKDLTIRQIIELHSAPVYTVYFIGFLPGFPYLGGLDPVLSMDRKPKPRAVIEKGSVGIGGSQTGIYPRNSPGGWNIIGRTPLDLFDPHSKLPTKINAGDSLKFEPVSKDEYDLIKVELESGTFKWRKEEIRD